MRLRSLTLKRALDVAGALVASLLAAPAMAAVALAVRLTLGRPVLFRQQRPGLQGRIFALYKFRTMTEAVDSSGALLPDAQRLTRLGRFLRTASLDELPQLWNVLKGDMSLVGPRPLLVGYLPLYDDFQRRRHEMKPGITGWAQIQGRNAISWEQRFRLDVWYVDNWDLALDLRILGRTLAKLLLREAVLDGECDNISMFSGTPRSS